jgi:hypothetical protein
MSGAAMQTGGPFLAGNDQRVVETGALTSSSVTPTRGYAVQVVSLLLLPRRFTDPSVTPPRMATALGVHGTEPSARVQRECVQDYQRQGYERVPE